MIFVNQRISNSNEGLVTMLALSLMGSQMAIDELKILS